MKKLLLSLACLLVATTSESFGDAAVRVGLFQRQGFARLAALLGGGVLLLGYGTLLNLAPLPFSRVVGLYIATLFVVWQVVNFATFRTAPGLPVLAGGALIVVGGLVVSFWRS